MKLFYINIIQCGAKRSSIFFLQFLHERSEQKMEPMLCYECGTPLSEKWDAFTLMRHLKLSSKEQKTHVDKRGVDPHLDDTLVDIFEFLRIDNYCCRQHFTCSKNIHQLM